MNRVAMEFQFCGGGVALMDEAEDLGAHAVVQPRDNVHVVPEPVWRRLAWGLVMWSTMLVFVKVTSNRVHHWE
jgi:hypothetical protein